MTKRARFVAGVALAAVLWAAGVTLLKAGVYGWTLLVLLPVLLGGLAAWIFRPATGGEAAALGALAAGAASLLFLTLGMEGFMCTLMSLPLIVPLGAFGCWLFYRAESSVIASRGLPILLLLSPATLTWDSKASAPVFEVQTSIEVAAPPEQVWRHVVSFSRLPAPREWIFRTGLAYPKRARIEGTGVGAIRYCEFSTGPFVEPIEVWDKPRRLAFRVTENPAPMEEWSPYGKVLPKHLHGYLVSKRGEFRLALLPDGRTRLAGTTWYQHGLRPAKYWRWWSDAIIHRIHLRVLDHVRRLAEKDAQSG
jgi:hypothetical protein